MSVLLLILGIVLFIGLVVTHEFGHFIMARRNGVDVEEFGIFFPPRLFKKKTKAGWDFTINLLPLGGFVRLHGEHDSDTEPGTFGAASLKVKTKIMAAGVVVNLLTALVLFTIVALIGMPQLVNNQYSYKSNTQILDNEVLITYVEPGSPAAKAGLQPQDAINDISLPGYSPVGVSSSEQLPQITKNFAGKSVIIYFTRAGQDHEARTTLRTAKAVNASHQDIGYLGIAPVDYKLQRSTWSAPIVAVGVSAQLISLTFQGIGHALGGLGGLIAGLVTHNNVARQNGQAAATQNVHGPVGVFEILQSSSLLGYQTVLFIVAYIALALAIINILPLPPMDGGRLWITLIARAVKHPLSADKEELINLIGVLLVITLFILITISDVRNPI